MSQTPDYYAILQVPSQADAAAIKMAYRQRAKQAHPDAGGSVELMQQVNEAHRVLADAASRQEYDRLLEALRTPSPATSTDQPHSGADTTPRQANVDKHRAELFHRMRQAQARASAWRILKNNAIAALLINIIVRFLVTQTSDLGQQMLFGTLGAVPVYGALMGLIFLITPDLRLHFHDAFDDLAHRRNPMVHTGRSEVKVLLALSGGFVPFAIIWAVLMLVR